MIASGGAAVSAATGIESTYADHTRGVQAAREGKYDEGLKLLRPLLDRFPDNYPLLRDVALVHMWKGDCDAAVDLFPRLKNQPQLDDYLVRPLADCAVKRAQAGDYDTGINVLTALRPHAADPYPLQRDLVLITTWTGDCRAALDRFEPIRTDTRNPPYLLTPVANCLIREGRRTEALTFIDAGLARYPDNHDLQLARTRALIALSVDGNYGDDRSIFLLNLSVGDSDRGAREWQTRVEASDSVTESLRVFGRYLMSRAADPLLTPGDMSRPGLGLRWYPDVRLLLQQEFSTDTDKSGLHGSHTRAEYKPYDTWLVGLAYDTYAEDISLRARAANIEAKRTQASAQYNRLDYVWSWRGVANHYDFNDTNQRNDFYTSLGYAYELLPKREQRVFLEWYQSRNTLDTAPYFNPKSDRSITLLQRTDFVFDSRFRRHVDHLYFWIGPYTQENFGTQTRSGAKYEMDFDFTSSSALVAGLGMYNNVYDGAHEREWRFELSYRQRF